MLEEFSLAGVIVVTFVVVFERVGGAVIIDVCFVVVVTVVVLPCVVFELLPED